MLAQERKKAFRKPQGRVAVPSPPAVGAVRAPRPPVWHTSKPQWTSSSWRLHRFSKRPLPSPPRPGQKEHDAQGQQERGITFELQIRRTKEKHPPRQRNQRWQRKQPDAI